MTNRSRTPPRTVLSPASSPTRFIAHKKVSGQLPTETDRPTKEIILYHGITNITLA
jgi:hypothetical protein